MYYYVNMPDKNGNLKKMVKVNTLTNGVTAAPYIWIDYVNPQLNEYVTVSFDYFTTCTNTTIYPYSFRENYRCSYWDESTSSWKGGTSTEVGIPVTPNKWNHIIYRFTKIDETYGSGPGYVRVGTTNSTEVYWLFDNIQVEAKDHATPYVNGTRPDSPIFDNSGYGYNGTLTGSESAQIQILPNSVIGNKYMHLPLDGYLKCAVHDFEKTDEFTYSIWFKHYGRSSDNATYLFTNGRADATGFGWGVQISTDVSITCLWGSSGRFALNVPKETWNLLTVSIKGMFQTVYLNGELKGTSSTSALPTYANSTGLGFGGFFYNNAFIYRTICDIADFKIYSTALSEEDIKAEYTRKASIDRNGNLFTGEVNEENTAVSVTKKNQVQTYSFKEDSDIAKFFGGYTQLAYIECNGAQYINTEYIPNYNTAIEGSFSHNEHVIDTPLFGVRTTNYNSSYTMWAHPLEYSSSGKNTMIFNDYQKSFSIGINEGLIENFYYSNNLMINNTERFTYTVSSGSPNLPLILLGLSNGGSIDSRKFSGKLYTFKIYDNGALVRDFVPAKRNKDSVIGLYDLVEHKFYTNQGTGTFTGGTEIGPLSAIAINEIKEN